MKASRGWALCALTFLCLTTTACVSQKFQDIEIEAEANPKANFAGYETYAWAAAAAIVRDPESAWAVPDVNIGAEIQFLVDRELRERGMTEVSASPDVLVLYGIGIDMLALNVVPDPDSDTSSLEEMPSGGLMVLLADPESRRLLWVGTATAELAENPSTELVKERLDYAVTQMFEELPD